MLTMTNDSIRRQAANLTQAINNLAAQFERPLRLMEVCGTHTVAIFRAGIMKLLPANIKLISGPGCPVCVTPNSYLDTAIAYSHRRDVIIATFGDMLRVPGSTSSLMAEKAAGADIRIVYSPMESVALARANRKKKVILLAVGFETTAPTTAATVLAAEQAGVDNLLVLSAHKRMPPALMTLLGATKVDGLLLPGHVCAVIGTKPFSFVAAAYRRPAVAAGFEALDILQALYMLIAQIAQGQARVINGYRQVVAAEGNKNAVAVMNKVYEPAAAEWRGLGTIAASGLALKTPYNRFDALRSLPVEVEPAIEHVGCRCGEVLAGTISPLACLLFASACTPVNPVGCCMVSSEGACAAWYKYGQGRWQS